MLVFSILFPIQIKWTNVEATPGTANPSTTSLNLTLSNDTIALNLTPLSSAGTFSSSTSANFTVSTNNVTGYTLSIKSSVSDPTDATEVANASRLVNTEDSTKYISSISGSVSESVFSNASNTQYNNMWGYKPSKLNSSDNTNYLAAPDYNTATILNTTSCANGTSPCTDASDSYSITLGARVDSTLPTGTYEHAFTIIAIGNPINYSITYHANDGANGANTTNMPSPNPQTGNAANDITSINLSTTKPTRSGYELKGWCDVQPIADTNYPDDQDCTSAGGTIYQPGDTFGIDQTTVNIVDLYATWWQPNLTKLNGKKMQDMSPMACYNSSINDTATLTDSRGKVSPESPESYTIAKLADGLCWMTTNLNLGKSNGSITLTPEDTDITTDFTLPASPSNYSATSDATNINTPNNLNNHTIASHTVNGVTYTTSVASYYTYAAATADTSTYSKSSDSYVNTSICPKNWDLPTESQYLNLRTKGSITSASAAFASPNTFTYGGCRNGTNSFSNETSYGYYWTSRNVSSTYAYWTNVSSSGLYSNTATYYKYYGAMIRCVASSGTATVNYNGNGTTEHPVTGTTAAQENVEINSTMAKANGFTRTGWWFNGWNTAPDGSGIAIVADAPLSNLGLAPDSTITLYAQWTPQQQLVYNDNCSYDSTGCTNTTDTTATSSWTTVGSNITLPAVDYKFGQTNSPRPGYAITSWNTARDGNGTSYNASTVSGNTNYQVPANLDNPGQLTLYAQWAPALTINFNNNGGSGTMASQVIAQGSSDKLRSNSFSAPSGQVFIGWMTETSRVNNEMVYVNQAVYTAPATVTPGDSITLYAKWGYRYTLKYSSKILEGSNLVDDTLVSGAMFVKSNATATATEITHANVQEGSTVNLIASNYKKTGYGFAGWAPAPGVDPNNNTGNVPIYGPNETITGPDYDKYGTTENSTKVVYLYPVWVAKETTVTMQTFNSTNYPAYNSALNGTIVALEDTRDNDVYAVAKLADGNWWMIENLRLDNDATITTSNTQSNNGAFGGSFTGLPNSVDTNWDSNTSNNLYTGLNAYTLPQLNTNNTNATAMGGTGLNNASGASLYDNYNANNATVSWYSYGNYYSWPAAMASTIQYTVYNGKRIYPKCERLIL